MFLRFSGFDFCAQTALSVPLLLRNWPFQTENGNYLHDAGAESAVCLKVLKGHVKGFLNPFRLSSESF